MGLRLAPRGFGALWGMRRVVECVSWGMSVCEMGRLLWIVRQDRIAGSVHVSAVVPLGDCVLGMAFLKTAILVWFPYTLPLLFCSTLMFACDGRDDDDSEYADALEHRQGPLEGKEKRIGICWSRFPFST